MLRQALLIAALAALAGLAGLAAGRYVFAPGAPAASATPAFDLATVSLPDLNGQVQSLSRFHGAPLVINFWATWCPPCLRELPLLDDWHARRDQDGIAVLAIALEPDATPVDAFVRAHGLGLPVWIQTPGRQDLSVRLGNQRSVLPYSVLLDANGKVIDQHAGELDAERLAAWRAKALSSQP